MNMKMKPLMIAVAIALGVSSTAFAQGAGSGTGAGDAAGSGAAGASSGQGDNAGSAATSGSSTGAGATGAGANDDSGGNTNNRTPRAGVVAPRSGVTATDTNAELRPTARPATPADERSTKGMSGTGSTTAPSGANPAFDNQEKVNGRPVPNSPDARTSLNDTSTSPAVADDHVGTTGKTNGARAAVKTKAHAQDAHAKAKHSTARSKTGADKTEAQNAEQHRTDEPFRDDVGRLSGSNPATRTGTTQ